MVRDPLATRFFLHKSRAGLHLHACSSLSLGRSVVSRWNLVCAYGPTRPICFTQDVVGIYMHKSTCAPVFRVSGTAECIVLNYGMARDQLVMLLCMLRVGYICTCACAYHFLHLVNRWVQLQRAMVC